jgi:hypothetical protein
VFPTADYEQWEACDRLISQAQAAIQLVADYGIKSEISALLFSRTGYYFKQKGSTMRRNRCTFRPWS